MAYYKKLTTLSRMLARFFKKNGHWDKLPIDPVPLTKEEIHSIVEAKKDFASGKYKTFTDIKSLIIELNS